MVLMRKQGLPTKFISTGNSVIFKIALPALPDFNAGRAIFTSFTSISFIALDYGYWIIAYGIK
jgi:hypothetical protein